MNKNNKPKICIPGSKEEIQKQINALEYILKKDTKEKDFNIHNAALKTLKAALEKEVD